MRTARLRETLSCAGHYVRAGSIILSVFILASMPRCLSQQCQTFATFNVEGSTKAGYCKRHAADGMINVTDKRCSHKTCTKISVYNVEGSKTTAYCKTHAAVGMVNVRSKRCSYTSCNTRPNFNVKGGKSPLYCKKHAEEGMVDVRNKRCSDESCFKYASYNLEGTKTARFCAQHAQDQMINVHSKRCIYDGCKKYPNFNVKGSRTKLYCKSHAQDGMVDVRNELRLNKCRQDGTPTTVSLKPVGNPSTGPDGDIPDEGVDTGQKRSRLAFDRSQALRCPDQRPLLQNEVVQSVERTPSQAAAMTLSSFASPMHVKDGLVPTAVKGTRPEIPVKLRPVAKGQPLVPTEQIKIELELTMKL